MLIAERRRTSPPGHRIGRACILGRIRTCQLRVPTAFGDGSHARIILRIRTIPARAGGSVAVEQVGDIDQVVGVGF